MSLTHLLANLHDQALHKIGTSLASWGLDKFITASQALIGILASLTGGLILWKYKQYVYETAEIDPRGKVIFVTGAASGIGKGVTELLLQRGCTVIATDLNFSLLEQEFKDKKVTYMNNLRLIKLDVTKQEEVARVAALVQREGTIYGVVNCAGILTPSDVPFTNCKGYAEMDPEKDVIPVFDVNVFGCMRVNTAFLPLLLAEAAKNSDGASIINIASIAGRVAFSGRAGPYCSTKFAINSYSTAQYRELKEYNIRVWTMEPGFVHTPLADRLKPKWDLSQTLLKERMTSQNESKLMKEVRAANWLTVPYVAGWIVQQLLRKNQTESHVLVDTPLNRGIWRILSTIPYSWMDKVLLSAER